MAKLLSNGKSNPIKECLCECDDSECTSIRELSKNQERKAKVPKTDGDTSSAARDDALSTQASPSFSVECNSDIIAEGNLRSDAESAGPVMSAEADNELASTPATEASLVQKQETISVKTSENNSTVVNASEEMTDMRGASTDQQVNRERLKREISSLRMAYAMNMDQAAAAGDVAAEMSYGKVVKELDDMFMAVHMGVSSVPNLRPFPAPYGPPSDVCIRQDLQTHPSTPYAWHPRFPYSSPMQSPMPIPCMRQVRMPFPYTAPNIYHASVYRSFGQQNSYLQQGNVWPAFIPCTMMVPTPFTTSQVPFVAQPIHYSRSACDLRITSLNDDESVASTAKDSDTVEKIGKHKLAEVEMESIQDGHRLAKLGSETAKEEPKSAKPKPEIAEDEPRLARPGEETAEGEPRPAKPGEETVEDEPTPAKPEQESVEDEPRQAKLELECAEGESEPAKPGDETAEGEPRLAKPEQETAEDEPRLAKPKHESAGDELRPAKPEQKTAGDMLRPVKIEPGIVEEEVQNGFQFESTSIASQQKEGQEICMTVNEVPCFTSVDQRPPEFPNANYSDMVKKWAMHISNVQRLLQFLIDVDEYFTAHKIELNQQNLEQKCPNMLRRLDCNDFSELLLREIVLICPDDFSFYLNPIIRKMRFLVLEDPEWSVFITVLEAKQIRLDDLAEHMDLESEHNPVSRERHIHLWEILLSEKLRGVFVIEAMLGRRERIEFWVRINRCLDICNVVPRLIVF